MPEILLPTRQSDCSSPDPHRRAPIPLPGVWQVIFGEEHAEEALPSAHGRKAICLQPLPQGIHSAKPPHGTRTHTYGRPAVCLPRLQSWIHSAGQPFQTYPHPWYPAPRCGTCKLKCAILFVDANAASLFASAQWTDKYLR